MPIRWNPREHLSLGIYVLKWTLILLPVAGVIGSACAFFLWSLDEVTTLRWQNPWLLFLLPLAGVLIGAIYHWLGRPVEGGNNLVVEQIHEPGGGIPSRMAPLVLLGTLLTHLFGGSAGREGTAVQMGGSIASTFSRRFSISNGDRRTLLMAGIAAGFGAVFGTPLTGAIFAMEVLAIGKMSYEALIPCLIASIVGDWTCAAWGVGHAQYKIELVEVPHFNALLLGKVALASVAFGLASLAFAELAHGLQFIFKKAIPSPILCPAVGGVLVIILVYVAGTRDFLGIGVTSPDPHAVTILSSFQAGGAHAWSWFWKILFTCVTISSGFKGGEVTPLFFVGAALGNVVGVLLGAPVDLFAGLGFVAVFAGAANTPLACTIMGVELFGSDYVVYFAVACFLAYLFSGHSGIYLSQKVGTPKLETSSLPADTSLRSVRQHQPSVHTWIKKLFGREDNGRK
jgi:H+/Cl- antiporter ClcA